MPPVFGHGRLRLYLLKLLAEAPRHGYEIIRLLEERFQGRYSPSAGTVYPRLAKLEIEGLVSHTSEGGRKIYAITAAGRAELADRQGELSELEEEITESLAELAADIQRDVSGSARQLREELRQASARTRQRAAAGEGASAGSGDKTPGWDADEPGSWLPGEAARRLAAEQMERAAQSFHKHMHGPSSMSGDWPAGLREGLDELGRQVSTWSQVIAEWGTSEDPDVEVRDTAGGEGHPAQSAPASGQHTGPGEATAQEPGPRPPRFEKTGPSDTPSPQPGTTRADTKEDPRRSLERMLDQFRDEIRDAARDRGVSEEQLRVARRHLSTANAHLHALLHAPESYREGTGER